MSPSKGKLRRNGNEEVLLLIFKNMDNKVLIWIIVILALIFLGWVVFRNRATRVEETNALERTIDMDENSESRTVKEVTVRIRPFSYSIDKIEVNEGDLVRINVINDQGAHDLVIEGYDIGTNVLTAGQKESLEFIADAVGEFEYYCSVDGHRDQGLKGVFIVK